MRIHADPDPYTDPDPKPWMPSLCNSPVLTQCCFFVVQEEEDDFSRPGDCQSLDRLSLQSQEEEEVAAICGRVAAWQRGLDTLLSDTYGLAKFTEFLKKEFSHENIYFWCACERYRLLAADGAERLSAARGILERHLEAGAAEPVNVDWTVRADSGQKLTAATAECPPPPDLFLAAQRQIYNLMKFDSYPRFLKSAVYADCLKQEMRHGGGAAAGQLGSAEYSGPHQPESATADPAITGGSGGGGKSMDRTRTRGAAGGGGVTQLWSSLGRRGPSNSCAAAAAATTAADDQERCDLTRVILPDGSTSVVSTSTGESIRALVARLLDKRGLRLACFDVFATREEFFHVLKKDGTKYKYYFG
jgi:regulator of G-protein signaling